MRKSFAMTAILACSLLMAAGAATAQPGARIAPAPDFIQVQSQCSICKGDCFDSIDCSQFCDKKCAGRCKAQFQRALKACLKKCGKCNPA